VTGNDRAIWEAWKYAKQQNYIPQDDPVPTRALRWYVLDKGLCKEEDIKDGWKIPAKAHDKALELMKAEGIEPGRDPLVKKDQEKSEVEANMDKYFDPKKGFMHFWVARI